MDEKDLFEMIKDFVTQVNIVNKRCITAVTIAFIALAITVIAWWAIYQLAPSNYGIVSQCQYGNSSTSQNLEDHK